MLRLIDITKTYISGNSSVEALKGINIRFRKNEFVSVLGPSGCGKTTLLNIIGGLDRYTTGDLFIAGKSTKQFKDADWDSYRNHSIGFIFQTYNLIHHQTVLANVELALTLSGVSTAERRKRAEDVLKKVGLGDQINKKPNQLSGGQMQRVAIARALVNDPEIILADEPTGALDSENSIQIMQILKEISNDKLIIMVTHNPELAVKYSTRIVKLLDGRVIDDTDPYESTEITAAEITEKKKNEKKHKVSMSYLTALSLSLNNLMTKKARTLLTSFAGSIGIIGIALILAMSSGFQSYIDNVQADTLSSYPISLEKMSVDYSNFIKIMAGKSEEVKNYKEGYVYSNDAIGSLLNAFNSSSQTNDLASFKKYIESRPVSEKIAELTNDIQYSYDLDMMIYTKDFTGKVIQSNPSNVMEKMMGKYSSMYPSATSSMQFNKSNQNVFSEMIDNQDLLNQQYDVIKGSWPKNDTEVVLVVSKNNQINNLVLYSLGIKDQEMLDDIYERMMKGEDYSDLDSGTWSASYDELVGMSFKLLPQTEFYTKTSGESGVWTYDNSDKNLTSLYENENAGITLKVSGIIKPKKNTTATSITGAIGYLRTLSQRVANEINSSEIIKAQKDSKIDVLTGFEFYDKNKGKNSGDFGSKLTDEQKTMLSMLTGYDDNTVRTMLQSYGTYSAEEIEQIIAYIDLQRASSNTGVDISTLPDDVQKYVITLDSAKQSAFLKLYLNDTYESNMSVIGATDKEEPSAINLYPKDFDAKEKLVDLISEYNKKMTDEGESSKVLSYNDYIGILLSSVSTIINVISYVLIAFVSISLVVSSIMIGVITYISVLERTKEIGILRSIGASKRDISRVFNAETMIVGLTAGLIGIGITLLIIVPFNIYIQSISGIVNIAKLPVYGAIALIVISTLLTLIAGIIPSKLAAKRDPVVALRTE